MSRATHNRSDPGIIGEISIDLNTSLDESLALMRSVRLPKFVEVSTVPSAECIHLTMVGV